MSSAAPEARSGYAAAKWSLLAAISRDHPNLPHLAYRTYVTLLAETWQTGLATASLAQLSAWSGAGRNAVLRALDELIALGLVRLVREGRPGVSAQYTIFDPSTLRGLNPTAADAARGLDADREAAAHDRIRRREALRADRSARLGRTPRPAPAPTPEPEAVPDVSRRPPSATLRALLSWAGSTWPDVRIRAADVDDPEAPARRLIISRGEREFELWVALVGPSGPIADELRRAIDQRRVSQCISTAAEAAVERYDAARKAGASVEEAAAAATTAYYDPAAAA